MLNADKKYSIVVNEKEGEGDAHEYPGSVSWHLMQVICGKKQIALRKDLGSDARDRLVGHMNHHVASQVFKKY